MKKLASNKNFQGSGVYSPAIVHSDFCFISGLLPIDINGNISNDFETQTRQCFTNLLNICKEFNGDYSHIVKINCYYTHSDVSPMFDKVMKELFIEPYPARIKLMVVGIAKDIVVEIDAIASLPKINS